MKIKTFKHSLGDIVRILKEKIEAIEEMNPPMNSHMAGILVGLREAYDLIMEERHEM